MRGVCAHTTLKLATTAAKLAYATRASNTRLSRGAARRWRGCASACVPKCARVRSRVGAMARAGPCDGGR
eukprot:2495026-Pleurochrysis_carterae.AAC.1